MLLTNVQMIAAHQHISSASYVQEEDAVVLVSQDRPRLIDENVPD